MNLSAPFIRRPVATTLLSLGLVVAGVIAFFKLPVSPLPDVDIPTIAVQATLPGASPADVAKTVASPLERHLGQIASVTEMTSASTLGSARITLQFDIGRDINGAARDVQAAINAARADLPTNLRSNPTYRKFNPASAPILIYTLTSDTLMPAELYDAASTMLAQKLSQIEGVGEVAVSGGSLPAVRVELIPPALYKYGIGLEDVRAALGSTNAHSPKGGIDVAKQRYQIYSNDQANKAEDYKSLIVAYRNGAPVRLSDVGDVINSVENVRTLGLANGKPAVMMIVYRQPGANIIQMVDRVKALMPQLRASVSPAIDINLAVDRSKTIRASLRDVEITLVIAVALVILVVFAFLRNARATLVPVVAVIGVAGGDFRRDVSPGLQPRHLLADGADGRHRLRGRRRHRRARKHHPPPGCGHVAAGGHAARLPRGRLHRAVDERVADRGICPDPADGRPGRPAVSRIRHDDHDRDRNLAGGLADDDADDVRRVAARRTRTSRMDGSIGPANASSRSC